MEQLPLAIGADPEPTLDNFVAGGNREALERLHALVLGIAREPLVYLWGAPGTGRTHLLRACARAAQGGYCGAHDALPAIPSRLTALDDVDRFDAERQHAAFHLVNQARECGASILAAGDAPPAALALREDLRTRLGGGLVYQLHPLGDPDKLEVLEREAARRGLRLGEDVARYLITRLPRDLRRLAAVLDRLDRYSLAQQRPITLPLVREALAPRTDGR